jgi:hypothetical protein
VLIFSLYFRVYGLSSFASFVFFLDSIHGKTNNTDSLFGITASCMQKTVRNATWVNFRCGNDGTVRVAKSYEKYEKAC